MPHILFKSREICKLKYTVTFKNIYTVCYFSNFWHPGCWKILHFTVYFCKKTKQKMKEKFHKNYKIYQKIGTILAKNLYFYNRYILSNINCKIKIHRCEYTSWQKCGNRTNIHRVFTAVLFKRWVTTHNSANTLHDFTLL